MKQTLLNVIATLEQQETTLDTTINGMTSQGLTSDQGGPVPQAAFDALFAFLTAQQAGSGIPAIVAQLTPLVAALPDGV